MKTQGEIEAAICEGLSRLEQEFMGRGPEDVHAYLLGDLVIARLQGVLTPAERQLLKCGPPEKARDLVKQTRFQLIESARRAMETLVFEATGVKLVSFHHDVSTVTGEEVVMITLADYPSVRPKKCKHTNSESRPAIRS
jgi:uncharacterized protein YbcI